MRIGIVGAGFIGRALAKLATIGGHEVMISNSRAAHTLASTAASIGCRTGTVADAVAFGDVVVVTIPFVALTSLDPALFAGKIVLDTCNYYVDRDGQVAGFDEDKDTTGAYLARLLPGARIVKAFNAILERDILSDARPKGDPDRRALPIAGDDQAARELVAGLQDGLGFDVVDVGPMAESWRFERGMPAYCIQLNRAELVEALAAATPGQRAPLGSWRQKRKSGAGATEEAREYGIANRGGLDIVDAQIHLMPNPDLAGTLAAMDALGIRTTIVDEFWHVDAEGRVHPSLPLPDGAHRPIAVRALEAAMNFPHRIAFLQRISRRDPDAAKVIATLAETPGCVGIRIILGSGAERAQFAEGEWDAILRAAAEAGLPVNLLTKDLAALAARACKTAPGLKLVLDHCGWCSSADEWPATLAMAEHANVYLKWSHPDRTFRHFADPAARKREGLVEAVRAFGADRVMWASDVTHEETRQSWFELLASVHGHPDLSEADRARILGGTARAVYGL